MEMQPEKILDWFAKDENIIENAVSQIHKKFDGEISNLMLSAC